MFSSMELRDYLAVEACADLDVGAGSVGAESSGVGVVEVRFYDTGHWPTAKEIRLEIRLGSNGVPLKFSAFATKSAPAQGDLELAKTLRAISLFSGAFMKGEGFGLEICETVYYRGAA
ncbi:hypothetical protein LTR15_009220 [Elasticomyces elasticus]|nr:hypothetical protein LTR15_009220 [Elasticomyces elasticus]